MRTIFIVVFYSFSLVLVSYFLLDLEAMLIHDYASQTEFEVPENVLLDALENMRYWNKFSVLFTFLLFLIKFCLIAMILYAGLFFANFHQGVKLSNLFKVAVFSESILVIAGVVKTVIVSAGDFTYSEFAFFYPLSVLSLFDPSEINSLLIYPLQLVNLFEIVYCFLLVFFFQHETEVPWGDSVRIVLVSYLFALVFWLVLILFLTLNFT